MLIEDQVCTERPDGISASNLVIAPLMKLPENSIEIPPVYGPVHGVHRPPGSKSITNRAVPIAAIAHGTSHLDGILHSQDTAVMMESLRRLGVHCEPHKDTRQLTLTGTNGKWPNDAAELWLENSGTSIRFLTGLCAASRGSFHLDGIARMRERPIGDLVEALQQIGLDATYEAAEGFPPVRLMASGLRGGTIRMSGRLSSQFLSSVLMAAPLARDPVFIEITDELVSIPYIEMTLAVMREFGVQVHTNDHRSFHVTPQQYSACRFDVEPDASAASYFFALAAVTGGRITVPGLHRRSLQGDIGFVDALERMGCEVSWDSNSVTVEGRALHGIDIDMNSISDTAQTLATVAVHASTPTRIRHVEHMRHKETDRISAVVKELHRAGIEAEEFHDGMLIHPGKPRPARIRTYDDHRMAMSFALLGLRAPGIVILDPTCTAKTYPDFFKDLSALCQNQVRR